MTLLCYCGGAIPTEKDPGNGDVGAGGARQSPPRRPLVATATRIARPCPCARCPWATEHARSDRSGWCASASWWSWRLPARWATLGRTTAGSSRSRPAFSPCRRGSARLLCRLLPRRLLCVLVSRRRRGSASLISARSARHFVCTERGLPGAGCRTFHGVRGRATSVFIRGGNAAVVG